MGNSYQKRAGAAYQEQVTGIPRNSDGSTTEYRVPYEPGPGERQPYVDFDGHVQRGQPPQEFLLDAKDGYQKPLIDQPWPNAQRSQLSKFEAEAARQLRALEQTGSDAGVEWHFSDEECADIVRQDFEEKGIDVDIVYTPST